MYQMLYFDALQIFEIWTFSCFLSESKDTLDKDTVHLIYMYITSILIH